MWQQYDPAAPQGLQVSVHVVSIIEAEQVIKQWKLIVQLLAGSLATRG